MKERNPEEDTGMTKTCSNNKDPSACSGAFVCQNCSGKQKVDLTITCGMIRIIKNLIFQKTIAIIGYKRKYIVSIIPYIDVATTTTAETTKSKDTEEITTKGIIMV